MKILLAFVLAVTATALGFPGGPIQKIIEYKAIPLGSNNTTPGYSMTVTISIYQASKDTNMTFAWVTSLYTPNLNSTTSFAPGNIYQTYVQGQGLALKDGEYNNAVCNMVY
jgi:hypothetical protein